MAEKKWQAATKSFSVKAGEGRVDVEEKIIKDVNDFINDKSSRRERRNYQKTWSRIPQGDCIVISCLVDYEELHEE